MNEGKTHTLIALDLILFWVIFSVWEMYRSDGPKCYLISISIYLLSNMGYLKNHITIVVVNHDKLIDDNDYKIIIRKKSWTQFNIE